MLPCDQIAGHNMAEGLVRLVYVVRAVDMVLVSDVVNAFKVEHGVQIVHTRGLVMSRRRHEVKARVVQQRIGIAIVAGVWDAGVVVAEWARWRLSFRKSTSYGGR